MKRNGDRVYHLPKWFSGFHEAALKNRMVIFSDGGRVTFLLNTEIPVLELVIVVSKVTKQDCCCSLSLRMVIERTGMESMSESYERQALVVAIKVKTGVSMVVLSIEY